VTLLTLLVRLLALYLGTVPLYAGTTGATHLLTRGPGAASSALGNTVVSVVHDPTALYWNPAGLAGAGGAVTGEHLILYDGARYNFFGLSVPSRFGSFGLGALQLHRGNIVARSRIDDPGREISNTQTDYLLGFARAIGPRWSAGAAANVLDFSLAGCRDIGVGLDLGVQARYPGADIRRLRRPVWNFGGVLKNLLEPVIRLRNDKETFPRELRLGAALGFDGFSRLSFKAGEVRYDRTGLLASVRMAAGEPAVHLGLGLSYRLQDMLVFRVGYEDEIVGGLGFSTSDGRFVVDYSLENKPLAKNHRFTLSYRFSSERETPDEGGSVEGDDGYTTARNRARALSDEHFARGKALFAESRYTAALEDLETAALLFPDDASRREFLSRAREVQRRAALKKSEEALNDASAGESTEDACLAAMELLLLRPEAGSQGEAAAGRRVCAGHSASLIAARKPEVIRLAGQGRYSEAIRAAESLRMLVSSASAREADGLAAWASTRSRSWRERLTTVRDRARSSGDAGRALQTASALARAFPGDHELRSAADDMRRAYLKRVSLSAKERLFLRKLYYLAALKYLKKEFTRSADLLHEVLRRNASDEPANALKDAMIRKGLMREVFDDGTREEEER